LNLWLISAGFLLLGSILAAMTGRARAELSHRLGQAGAVAGCALGLVAAVGELLHGADVEILSVWNIPGGQLHLGMDALSAFFLLPVCGIGLLSAVYGRPYLQGHAANRDPGSLWLHYNLLIFGMMLVLTARDALLFMLAWEIMALAPFFLVGFEDEQKESRHAAWIYLIASHLGAVFLLVMFVLLASLAGTSNFSAFAPALAAHADLIAPVFVMALIGFGSKAGFVPTHVWLPEAHPAAPSHVSALMSGVMIKMGIYGLIRVMMMMGPPQAWWGWTLIMIGAVSGILGVVFALAQHNLKRLLAYHSVENIGIIVLGLGIGVLGLALGNITLAVAGLAGGLLHIINHSIFKSLLFLGAGAVQYAIHSLDIEHMGGLLKRMPVSGMAFIIGAAAITGVPPLNGFISEFLIFLGSFGAVAGDNTQLAAGGAITLTSLALISGLAAACFAKVVGIAWLGEPRSEQAQKAKEVPAAMVNSMLVLAGLCILIGFAGAAIVNRMTPLIAQVADLDAQVIHPALAGMVHTLAMAVLMAGGVVVFVAAILWFVRSRQLAHAGVQHGPTWGCGYADPTPRMQYTASSFADSLNSQFAVLMHVSHHTQRPQGLFPTRAHVSTIAEDPFHYMLFAPSFRWVNRLLERAEIIQRGHTHIYILYVAITLLVVLIATILTL